jgi:hypothetical protein
VLKTAIEHQRTVSRTSVAGIAPGGYAGQHSDEEHRAYFERKFAPSEGSGGGSDGARLRWEAGIGLGCGHGAMSVQLARADATVVGDPDEQWRDWRERICNRRLHATGRFPVHERPAEEARGVAGAASPRCPATTAPRVIAVGNG